MALATQCPFCQTTFRVAQDQLKLRGGLVRCGNCKEVFNGNDHLVAPEIARQLVVAPATSTPLPHTTDPATAHAPLGWPPLPGSPPAPPAQVVTAAATPAAAESESSTPAAPPPWMATANLSAAFASIAAETSDAPWGAQPAQKDEAPAASATEENKLPVASTAASRPDSPFPLPGLPAAQTSTDDAASRPASAAADASINTLTQALSYPLPHTSSVTLEDVGTPAAATDAVTTVAPKQQAYQEDRATGVEEHVAAEEEELEEEQDDGAADDDAPAFVQKAERRERLSRIARIVMTVGAVILGIGLLLQATYVWRNTIAAWLPSTRPLLTAACAPLHCSVGLPTSIDQLVLDSSELQLVPPNQNIYTLSALLRNRGYSAQAWPYLELTLNDGDEKALTRRVFTPREYLGSAQLVDKGLAGEGEQQIKLTFELAQPAASGYRVYLFYP